MRAAQVWALEHRAVAAEEAADRCMAVDGRLSRLLWRTARALRDRALDVSMGW